MVQTYFSQYKGKYFTGDGAKRDADAYYWVTGRVDDVLNVSGSGTSGLAVSTNASVSSNSTLRPLEGAKYSDT